MALMLSAAIKATVTDGSVTYEGLKAHDGSVEASANSEVWVIAGASSTFKGRTKVYFNRLNLADLANFKMVPQQSVADYNLYDIFDTIRNQTGITFTQADLEPAVVVDTGTQLQILLKAKTGSLGFVGEYTLRLKNYPDISTVFTSNVLAGF